VSELLRQRCLRSERAFLSVEPEVRDRLETDRQTCAEYLLRHAWCENVREAIAAYSVPSRTVARQRGCPHVAHALPAGGARTGGA